MTYYVIEGIDTSGKTTQCNLLKKRLNGIGLNDTINKDSIIFINEPSNTYLGRQVRDLALHATPDLSNKVKFFLFLAQRAELFEYISNLHNIVISDRSFLSGICYGDYDIKSALYMNLCAIGCHLPEKIIFLHISEKELQKRMSLKKLDSIESKGIGYLMHIQNMLKQAIHTLKDIMLDSSMQELLLQYNIPINYVNYHVEIKEIDSSQDTNYIHEEIYNFLFG